MVDTVERLEKLLGSNLPEDYRRFAVWYTGFENTIGKEYIRLWDIDEIIQLNSVYQIFTELEDRVGIDTNGAGEFIAIEKIKNEGFRVVISPFIDLDKTCHIEIGESFSDFFRRL